MIFARHVIEQDLPQVLDMARGFHAESPVHRRYVYSDAKVEQLVRHAMDDGDWLAIVACNDDGVIGFSLFFAIHMFFGPDIEVADLAFYVAPPHRGTRAAFLMVREIEKFAELHQASKVSIAAHTGINHAATLSFFNRLGYAPAGDIVSKILR